MSTGSGLPLPVLAESYIGTIDFLMPQMAVVAPADEVRGPVCPECPAGVRVNTLPCCAWGEGWGHVTPEWVLHSNLRLARANLSKPEW